MFTKILLIYKKVDMFTQREIEDFMLDAESMLTEREKQLLKEAKKIILKEPKKKKA